VGLTAPPRPSDGVRRRVPLAQRARVERLERPRGTLAMVNMRGLEGLEAWTLAIQLVA
jgi:hypothetical protein